MSIRIAEAVLSSSAAQSRSNSINRREKTRDAFINRMWVPLNNRHHTAPRRRFHHARRHHGSSRSPQRVTTSAMSEPSARSVA
jgi:hypothetical protein